MTGGAGGSVCCVCEGWVVVSGGVGLGVVVGAGFVGVGFVGAGLVEAVVGAARLRRAVRTAAVLACLGAVAGLLLAFYLTFVCSYASLSAANLLVFLLMWLVPTPLIAGMVNKY